MRYRISKSAERDLDEIYLYWADRVSEFVAGRLIDAIVVRFWLIREFPDAGRRAEGIRPGVRCFPAGDYLIYYRASRRFIDILRILRGTRNQPRAFKITKKSRL